MQVNPEDFAKDFERWELEVSDIPVEEIRRQHQALNEQFAKVGDEAFTMWCVTDADLDDESAPFTQHVNVEWFLRFGYWR